ncbi:cytochrome b [Nissabacter archeti]|uniref:Cytochrome b n=1 Tax=Nissabacter archeti TaxID=1917880 RepID=A0ABS5JIS7_9GAMM|nr:cytochrome b [Nissabacter archeti]MBS0969883.1 cytochrome b [Nissabacter archeti]
MHFKNDTQAFGHTSVLIHWLAALVIYGMFALGLWMVTLGYYDVWYHRAPELHKSIGVLLAALILFRIVWRFVSPPPLPLSTYSATTRIAATTAHLLLLAGLIGILVTGYLIATAEGQPISVFGWFGVPALVTLGPAQTDLAGDLHLWLAWGVVVLSVLHALAALKHHFIDGDVTLKRMLGRRSS